MDTLYSLSQFQPHHESYLRLLGILVRHLQENFSPFKVCEFVKFFPQWYKKIE